MAEFHAAYIELKEANLAALDRGRAAILRRNRAVERMDVYLSGLAGYVNSVGQGDREILFTSGFELVRRPEPFSSLRPPRKVTARPTVYPRQIKLRWQRTPGAVIYQVEHDVNNTVGAERWERVTLTTRTFFVMDDMPSHVEQTFRVLAIGTKTVSPYSQSVFGKAI